MNTKNTCKSLLSGVLMALFFTAPTFGQMEFMMEATRPEYMSRDLVIFAEALNLDDTQEVIVEAMFDSYEDDFELGWATTQERINRIAVKIQENQPASTRETLEPVLNAIGDWLEEKRTLDDGLLENVKAILVEDQRELWPSFSQGLYRTKHMSRGRLSGESVDLFLIARDSDLSPTAESVIADNLDEYAVALDIAMRTRDAILRGNPKKLFDNILSANSQRSPSFVDDLIRARIEVRDLNDRYIEIICSGLVESDSTNFRNRALKRGYPRIFRRTPAQRIFRQAAENENYSAEICVQILQLEGAYLQELANINYELRSMTQKHEPEAHRNRELAGQVRRDGGTPQKLEDPTRDKYKHREEVGKGYIEMLRALLSPEQFLELDGARRWIPRSEQQNLLPPDSPAFGPDGGLSLQGGNSSGTSQKGGDSKGKGKPDSQPGGGFGNEKDGRSGPSKPGS